MTIRCHHPGVGSMKPFEVDTGGLSVSLAFFWQAFQKRGGFFSELKDVEGKVSEFFLCWEFHQNMKNVS